MGMGTAACTGWIISLDAIRELCPNEVKGCEDTFVSCSNDECEMDWNSFANDLEMEAAEGNPLLMWEILQKAFAETTKTGDRHLELNIGYYYDDEGDRYDELEGGAYFYVDGMTQLTSAGERFKDKIEKKSWTVYG